ncbi:protein SRC2 homolog [Rutidosis leptorrhynchoides]|uniref:protein SRC2 homolog n=1 Tax=Rutidosis leptorrhynchoides TaxID=125765 RepID=UPI003A9974E0
MEYRTLDLTLISAKGLKTHSVLSKKIDTYAVVSITGSRFQQPYKLQTPVDKIGGTEPQWNHPMKFKVEEAAAQQNALTLVIKIKGVRMFGSKKLGEVKVPVKELLEGVTNEGKSVQFVSYQLRKTSGKINGAVSFSYKFGEKFEEPVVAYPPGFDAARGYYAPPIQQGYYAPPPAAAYGGYPPQVVQQAPVRRSNNMGLGLGAGLLGGLLVGDMISHSGGCGGGGCGGGGCGGGCGGGGCGG